jgi:MFS family permease
VTTVVEARGSLLREPGFRAFFVAHTVSQLGDRVSELAFPLVAVVLLDASAAQVSVLTALVWVPSLGAVFLGGWVDGQRHKKRLLVVADVARAGLLLTVPVAFAAGVGTMAQLYVVALLTGAGAALFNTTYPAYFVLLVDRSSYLSANGLLSAGRSASFIAGPAVGGALAQALTAPFAILVDAVSFLASALCIGRIRLRRTAAVTPTDGPGPRRLWGQAVEGLRYTLADPILRGSLGCSTTMNFFTYVFGALLVLFASRTLDLPSGLLGLALGIGAVGGLFGALLAPRLSARIGVGSSILIGAVVFPASIVLTAAASGPLWFREAMVAGSEFFSGIGVMLFDVNLNGLKSALVPDGLRSRVAGAYSAVNYGIRPLGALTGGALGAWLGLRPTLFVAAVGGTLCALWLLPSPIPRLRSIDAVRGTTPPHEDLHQPSRREA